MMEILNKKMLNWMEPMEVSSISLKQRAWHWLDRPGCSSLD